MAGYLSRLYEKHGYKVLLLLGLLFALSAISLSLLALHTEEKPLVAEKQIGPEGVLAPLWSFYDIPYGIITNDSYIEFNTTCTVDVLVTFIDRSGDLHNITVKAGETKIYNINDLSTIIWVKPSNCTLSTKLHATTIERKYMYLAIPSLILFIVSTVFMVLAIVEKVMTIQR
ncbi:hypothetical protein J4526_04910 [Desulfurococcaceae archaeon MEX13E-LK6-19]|nr:hypothetical protein J4526_04910 [Desulfurococcaceae archaeon MEX13E-LK6-19]